MAKCKDCLHFEACKYMYEAAFVNQLFPFGTCDFGTCDQYKDRSRFVELPCKVGDAVYETDGIRIYPHQIKKLIFDVGHIAFDESAIGTSILLTREEAEAELARRTANG